MTANLHMKFDNIYQLALSIPVEDCQRFSIHPLTWLRYLAFTISGCEGIISSQPDGAEVQYYEADIQSGNYYYISQESFLLDPNLMDDRTTNTTVSTGRGDFAQKVKARDRTCVMTGDGYTGNLEACHIIPHSKGHQYIINLGHHRHEALDPPLDDINDTRNGILLTKALHHPLGASQSAFLQTPNFAMSVTDVNIVMQLLAPGFTTPPSEARKRLTFQHFISSRVTEFVSPHNSDARISDSDNWPPPLIFDVAYGCAALKTWGLPLFVESARRHTKGIYYNNVNENDDKNGGGGDGSTSMTSRDLRALKRQKIRNVGQQGRSSADSDVPDAADMILGLWTYNARKAKAQVPAMKASRNQEKIEAWRNSIQ